MDLRQEIQDLPGRFHKQFKDRYNLGERALPPLIIIPQDELYGGYARQRLKIYTAEIDFGLIPFEREPMPDGKSFLCLRYHLLVDQSRRPTYQRLANVLNLERDVLREIGLEKRDMRSLLSLVGRGRIQEYDDVSESARQQKAGLFIASDVEIRHPVSIVNKHASPEQRAEALWCVGIKPLLFVTPISNV